MNDNSNHEKIMMNARGGGKSTLHNQYVEAIDKYTIQNMPDKPIYVGTPSSSYVAFSEPLNIVSDEDEKKASYKIEDIRNKIGDLVSGENKLVPFLNPQTVREMIKEMRREVREIKEQYGLEELDIISYLELKQVERQAYEDQSRREEQLPF